MEAWGYGVLVEAWGLWCSSGGLGGYGVLVEAWGYGVLVEAWGAMVF